MLDLLSNEVVVRILKFVDTSDLFELRMVSRKMKQIADDLLRRQTNEIKICGYYEEFEQLEFLCDFFPNITVVTLKESHIDFKLLLNLFKQKLGKLECIRVNYWSVGGEFLLNRSYYCNCDNVHSIGYRFENISSLEFIAVDLQDESMSRLFATLNNLQHLKIHRTRVNGKCFKDICSSILSIDWYIDLYVKLNDSLVFNGKLNGLQSFSFQSQKVTETEGRKIMGLVISEMKNLKRLRIVINSQSLYSFDGLNLLHLRELNLNVNSLNNNSEVWILREKILSLEKLNLTVSKINDDILVSFLDNFPNVKILEFSVQNLNEFSSNVVNAITALHNLKVVKLSDWNYSTKNYTAMNKKRNSLIELVESLPQVKEFSFVIGSWLFDDFSTTFIDSIEEIALKRSHQQFHIILRGVGFNGRDVPSNVKIEN
ncbi:hypothetical protein B4U80_13052 [Leptotrombidium deliense]|uniref:F-box domain-containing protein n=1 Tax=Leptotrombidium deliense TaxID=299467 RepID=A0A443SDV0_9ACAR|nr:hypothetical protein B4U80_13052 [Leptotrombidium deliense]